MPKKINIELMAAIAALENKIALSRSKQSEIEKSKTLTRVEVRDLSKMQSIRRRRYRSQIDYALLRAGRKAKHTRFRDVGRT